MTRIHRRLLLIALLGCTSTAWASDETAARHRIGSSPNALVRGSEDKDSYEVSRMKDTRKSMQALMAKLHAETDANARRELLQQHSAAMQAHLETIRAALDTGALKAKALQERTEMMQGLLDEMQAHQKIADSLNSYCRLFAQASFRPFACYGRAYGSLGRRHNRDAAQRQ